MEAAMVMEGELRVGGRGRRATPCRAVGAGKRRAAAVAIGLGAALLLASSGAGAQRFEDTEIQAAEVADGLHMLVGEGGNIAVAWGPEGVLLVDDQFAPLTEKILAAIRTFTSEPVRFVVNTHWHFDHTGGNENLGRAGAVIVAHENVRRRLEAGQFMELFRREVPPAPPEALPVVTFSDGVSFHWNGQEIAVSHVTRAHTDGDSIVWFRGSNAVHMGDLFFHGRFPFIDVQSGGAIDGMIAGVDRVLAEARSDTRIIPGHGPLAGRADLERYRAMLADVRGRVREGLARGLGADELVAEKPLADLEPAWGGGFLSAEAFLRIVHDDLSR
jgi:cyclase